MNKTKLLCIISIIIILSALTGCHREEIYSTAPDVTQQNNGTYTEIGGPAVPTLLLAKSPYKVTSDITVDSLGVLNIQEGVKVYFESNTGMIVYGKLLCTGTSGSEILLTSFKSTWKGIKIRSNKYSSVIRYTTIENVDLSNPVDTNKYGAVDIRSTNVDITNSIFKNNKAVYGGALYIEKSFSSIKNNIFINNFSSVAGGAVISISSSNKIINNTFYSNISNNYAGGLYLLNPFSDNVQNNIFYKNKCISGDPDIAISENGPSNTLVQYNFIHANKAPGFISNSNFHLTITSPCIDQGNPGDEFKDTDGSRNDQGAYGGPLGDW